MEESTLEILKRYKLEYGHVVACVLTKVGKPNWDSGKQKKALRCFLKKALLKLYKDQIVKNRSSEETYFMSSETYEHLFSILILG